MTGERGKSGGEGPTRAEVERDGMMADASRVLMECGVLF